MSNRGLLRGLCLAVVGLTSFGAIAEEDAEFTDEFPVEDCWFVPYGGNDFFSLQPGRTTYFNNAQCVAAGDCDEREDLWITVTRDVKKLTIDVDGRRRPVWARVIEETEEADGELAEISRNYFASCLPSRDVYYFGEDVDIYEEGEIVSHDGSWLAGTYGAKPGVIMPESAFILGQRYYQEVAPGVALDRAEHVETAIELGLQAGNFEGCIEVTETTPLEPDAESTKFYCPGAGLVIDNELEAIYVYPRGH